MLRLITAGNVFLQLGESAAAAQIQTQLETRAKNQVVFD